MRVMVPSAFRIVKAAACSAMLIWYASRCFRYRRRSLYAEGGGFTSETKWVAIALARCTKKRGMPENARAVLHAAAALAEMAANASAAHS